MSQARIQLPETIATLGEAVRYIREQRDMSLRTLANKIGVSAPFLSDLEHNRRSTDRLDDLAKALEVSPELLRKFDGRLTPELKDWITGNPSMVALLNEWRSTDRSVDDIRSALNKSRKR